MLELRRPRLSRHLLLSRAPVQFISTKTSCLDIFHKFTHIFAKQQEGLRCLRDETVKSRGEDTEMKAKITAASALSSGLIM